MNSENSFESILVLLSHYDVRFILIGGLAAMAHGSARATFDIDVVYDRADDNIAALVSSFSDISPYLRDVPPGLPFKFDQETIRRGLNFTLTTSVGDVDLLGEVTGGGNFVELLPNTISIEVFGVQIRCVSLACLIHLKQAAGRPKDLEAIAELQALQEELDRSSDGA